MFQSGLPADIGSESAAEGSGSLRRHDAGTGFVRGIWAVLQRQLGVLGAICLAGSMVGTAVFFLTPVQFEAVALVEIEPNGNRILAATGVGGAEPHDRLPAEVERIRSTDILKDLAAQLDPGMLALLPANPNRWLPSLPENLPFWNAPENSAIDRPHMRLRQAFTVVQMGGSPIVAVKARAADPNHAAELANRLVALYLEQQNTRRHTQITVANAVLDLQMTVLREQVAAAKDYLERLTPRPRAASSGQARSLTVARERAVELVFEEQELQRTLSQVHHKALATMPQGHIMSTAQAPDVRVTPDGGLLARVIAAITFMVALAAIFVRDAVSGGFSREDELETCLDLPVGACVPAVSRGRLPASPGGDPSAAGMVHLYPRADYAEALRTLRTELALRTGDLRSRPSESGRRGRVVLVTSAKMGEGRTSLSLALGRTFALSGYKTLVMDGDFRRPDLHRHLDADPPVGQTRYLAEHSPETALQGAARVDEATGARLLLGAWQSGEPESSLLVKGIYHRLIEQAVTGYDMVIVDTAPVLMTADTQNLACLADIALFVVRRHATSRADAAAALQRLARAASGHTKMFAVFNQTRPRRWRRRVADVGFVAEERG